MKIGVISPSLSADPRVAMAKCSEMGVDGIQLWIAGNELDPKVLTKSGRAEVCTELSRLGLELPAVCGDVGGFSDASMVDERISHTKMMVDLCVDLGTTVLTSHIGGMPEDMESSAYCDLVSALREVGEYAASRGCSFATETGLESGADLVAFIKATGSAGVRVNYDPANLCMMGFDHMAEVRVLSDYIVHTHAKDGIARSAFEGGYKEVALGDGDVNFPEYLGVLRELGYSGFLTIERECGDDPVGDVMRAVEFLRTLEGVESRG